MDMDFAEGGKVSGFCGFRKLHFVGNFPSAAVLGGDFLLVINSNFGCISYRYRDIDVEI